jgi:hypothetical protein
MRWAWLLCLLLLGARFPPDSGVIDVRDYGAIADDGLDDWAAFRAAQLDSAHVGRVMHVPDGAWDLSAPLKAQNAAGLWVANWVVHCQSRAAVLRIMPGSAAFQNASAPQGLLVFGSTNGNAPSSVASGGGDEGFRNSVYNCTIDRGTTNPGAHGIDWVCSNRGVVRGVRVIGGGRDAISMARAYPGPCLIADSDLEGGARGLHMTQVQYGLTLRAVRMLGQTVRGIDASANLIHAEDVHIAPAGAVAAISMTSPGAQLTCIRCTFGGGAASRSAIELGADTKAFVRDSSAVGSAYASLLKQGAAVVPGIEQSEWVSHAAIPPGATSLRLPELPPPAVFESEDPADWASPTHYGCAAGDTLDDLACAQQAADSGRPVLYFASVAAPLVPRWRFSGTLDIPCSVRRIVGLETIPVAHTGRPAGLPLLRFDAGCSWSDVTTVEGFWGQADLAGGAWIEHRDARTLYVRDLQGSTVNRGVAQLPGAGRLFLENVAIRTVEIAGDAWAWQLNLEGIQSGPGSFVASGGRLRALGVKTEGLALGGAPTLQVQPGAAAELLGGLYMPCVGLNPGLPQLGFLVEDGDFSASWTNWCSVTSKTAATWAVQVRATQDGVTTEVRADDLPSHVPGMGWKVLAPLYVSRRPGACEVP